MVKGIGHVFCFFFSSIKGNSYNRQLRSPLTFPLKLKAPPHHHMALTSGSVCVLHIKAHSNIISVITNRTNQTALFQRKQQLLLVSQISPHCYKSRPIHAPPRKTSGVLCCGKFDASWHCTCPKWVMILFCGTSNCCGRLWQFQLSAHKTRFAAKCHQSCVKGCTCKNKALHITVCTSVLITVWDIWSTKDICKHIL